jgi:hypothetical protein
VVHFDWGQRALTHARLIVSAYPGRGSATRAEALAADYVRHHLGSLEIRDLRFQPFTGSRSLWFFLSLAFGVAIMGHLAFGLMQPAVGRWPAWGLSLLLFGFSFYLLWRKYTFHNYPLQEFLPRGPSQNVIAVLPPGGAVKQRIVISAHLDSHRSVIWFATDLLVSIYTLLFPLAIWGTLLAPIFYALGILSGLQVFGWFGIAIAFLQFIIWFTGVTADLGVYSPGANDNASGVGTLLAIAEHLYEQPLAQTEIWCVFTGCAETGCDGMRALLAEYHSELRQAVFINLELLGIGDRLVYLQKEGVVRRRRIPRDLEKMLSGLTGSPIQPVSWGSNGAFSEMGAVWERGLPGFSLLTLRAGSNFLPEWHRMSDTSEKLSADALQCAQSALWDILRHLDQNQAGSGS